jgi:Ca2+-binding RTX toxin-like protein
VAIINGTSGPDHEVGTIDGDTIYGFDGNDGLFAGAGNDFVYGNGGDDIIGNDYGNDLLNGGSGIDTVTFNYVNQQNMDLYPNAEIGVVFDLAITTQQNLGAWGLDTIVGFENASGSLANDKLFGNAYANVINGDEGNDTVDGRSGKDWVSGGWGRDSVIGGRGADRLFGNGPNAGDDHARDHFRFRTITDSGVSYKTWDQITGYFGGAADDDRINLSTIDADPTKVGNQAFKWVGSGPFTSQIGEVRVADAGNHVKVYLDADGDANTEMIILVRDVASLAKIDFVL